MSTIGTLNTSWYIKHGAKKKSNVSNSIKVCKAIKNISHISVKKHAKMKTSNVITLTCWMTSSRQRNESCYGNYMLTHCVGCYGVGLVKSPQFHTASMTDRHRNEAIHCYTDYIRSQIPPLEAKCNPLKEKRATLLKKCALRIF